MASVSKALPPVGCAEAFLAARITPRWLRAHAADAVDHGDNLFGVDACLIGCLRVAADRVDGSAEGGLRENHPDKDQNGKQEVDRRRNAERRAKTQVLHVLRQIADGLALADDVAQSAQGNLHGKRHGKGRNVQIRDDKAVDETDQNADKQRNKNRGKEGHDVLCDEACHNRAAHTGDRADRQVNAACDNDERSCLRREYRKRRSGAEC